MTRLTIRWILATAMSFLLNSQQDDSSSSFIGSMTVSAFTIQTSTTRHDHRHSLFRQYAAAASEETSAENDNQNKINPLSRQEVQTLLDTIPVFAVTSPEGLVLLKEQDSGDQQFAHFFFSPEAANAMYKPLRQAMEEKNKDDSDKKTKWDITSYPLGVIWFELLHPMTINDDNPIQYRLVAEPESRAAARALVQESAKQSGAFLGDVPSIFEAPFDEIPVFMDQFLRIATDNGAEKFPFYFGYPDLMQTLQQASSSSDETYQAALSVVDLQTLVAQMMAPDSPNDYRNILLIPPSPPQASSEEDDSSTSSSAPEELVVSTMTATESWDD